MGPAADAAVLASKPFSFGGSYRQPDALAPTWQRLLHASLKRLSEYSGVFCHEDCSLVFIGAPELCTEFAGAAIYIFLILAEFTPGKFR